jgi:hypothetical protein
VLSRSGNKHAGRGSEEVASVGRTQRIGIAMIYKAHVAMLSALIASCTSGVGQLHKEGSSSGAAGRTVKPAQWVFVGELDHGKQRAYVDAASIQVTGEIRRAWVKWVLPGDNFVVHQSYIMYGTAFNCAGGTNRDEAEVIYYSDGTIYSDITYGEGISWIISNETAAKPWLTLPPGTPWSAALKFVCEWSSARADSFQLLGEIG